MSRRIYNTINHILTQNYSERYIKEFHKGAFLVLHDNGKFYYRWKNNSHRTFFSTHMSHEYQYRIKIKLCRCRNARQSEILFGLRKEENTLMTWIQLERNTIHHIDHVMDTLCYLSTGKNQGPHGQSHYTDKNPLHIRKINFSKTI